MMNDLVPPVSRLENEVFCLQKREKAEERELSSLLALEVVGTIIAI
jgi:hypothetical protein